MSGASPRTDPAAYHYCSYSGVTTDPRGEHVSAKFARTLESDLAEALAVIREHLAAHEAKFPPAEDGQQAQDAWAQRIADADNTARSVLSKHAKGS